MFISPLRLGYTVSSQKAITVIGAGISGLVLGRALRSKGIPVVLYERVKTDSPRHSYSLTLFPWAYAPLLKLLEIDVTTFRHKVAAYRHPADVSETSLPFRVNRASLEGLLREGLSIIGDHNVTRVQQDKAGFTLSFDHHQPVQSAVLVAADGPLSQVRQSLVPGCQLKVHPFAVINGKRYVHDEAVIAYFNEVTEHETRREDILLQSYVNDHENGKLGLSYTYSRPARHGKDPLHKPNRPISGATDIPDEYYAELANLKDLKQPFKSIFDPQEVRHSQSLHWLMRSAMVARSDVVSLAQHGVFLIGDALHATPILGSTGANMAITDALELGHHLTAHSPPQDFYNARYEKWEQYVEASEKRLALMHQGQELSSL